MNIHWRDRLKNWLKTQHGTAGWEMKLENFIKAELKREHKETIEEMIKYAEKNTEYRNFVWLDDLKSKFL